MDSRMIAGESRSDFQKQRELGQSLIGSEVRFKAFRYDAVQGKHIETGEILTGKVSHWDDVTGNLQVHVTGDYWLTSVDMANLVE